MDNTRETAKLLLRTLVAQGFEPPAIMHQKGGADEMADDWSRLLNFAGVTAREAVEALARYIVEPNATQYRKPWPDVGMLVARSEVGRAMQAAGTDADQAFADFQAARRRMIARAIPDGEVRADRWDRDPLRSEAMHAGWETWPRGTSEPDPSNEFPFTQARKAWCAAYTLARKGQAQDRDARRMLVGTSQPQLPGAK